MIHSLPPLYIRARKRFLSLAGILWSSLPDTSFGDFSAAQVCYLAEDMGVSGLSASNAYFKCQRWKSSGKSWKNTSRVICTSQKFLLE